MIHSVDAIRKRLRPQHLRLVLALSARGTLRGAADDLAITQPAATKALQELEDLIGVALFVRHPRGMRATAFGNAVIGFARVVSEDLAQLREVLASIEAGDIGRVRIGTIMAPAPGLLTQVIVALKAQHPQLQFVVRVDTSDMLVQSLRQRELDLVFGRIPHGQPTDDLIVHPFGEEDLSIVGGPSFDANAGTIRDDLSRLTTRRWILQPHPSPMRQIIEKTFHRQRLAFPTDIVETSSIMMTVSLLSASDMLAVLPRTVAEQYQTYGLLSILDVAVVGRLDPYGLISRKNQIRTPVMQMVIDTILNTRP